jgi:hypothetical protein
LPDSIVAKKIIHIVRWYRCPHCGKSQHNAPDNIINGSLLSESVMAVISSLNTTFHQSILKIKEMLSGHFGVELSSGKINNSLILVRELGQSAEKNTLYN